MTSAQIKADMSAPFSDFPTEAVTIAGTTYQGLITERITGSEWVQGGEVPIKSIRFALKRTDVVTLPQQGDAATYDGVAYIVGAVDPSASEENVVVELAHQTQT